MRPNFALGLFTDGAILHERNYLKSALVYQYISHYKDMIS